MGDQSKKEENAVFIGNLKKDASKDELKKMLVELFKHDLKIGLTLHDIKMKSGKNKNYAFIYLNSNSDRDKAIEKLDSRESRSQMSFDFLQLVEPNQIIKVGAKKPVVNDKADIKPKLKQEKREKIRSSDNKTKLADTSSQHIKQGDVSAQLIHGNSENLPEKGGGVLRSASDDHDNGGNAITKYIEDQLLGTETRNKEFKLGGGTGSDQNLTLKKHVSKYLCGFLNSSQKGTLYIGVEDSGAVKGIECDQPTEDKIRLRIDETVETFKPALFPQKYHVDFIPVYKKDGTLKNNCKVLQITVDKVNLKQLYQADGKAYMRRDGSVVVLDPAYIQEWCNEIHQREVQKQELEISELKKEITVVKEENKHLKKNKSKVCVLM